MMPEDAVISHQIKGELDIVVPERLSAHTLTNLLASLPLPQFHLINQLLIEEDSEYDSDRKYVKTGKWKVHIEWVVPDSYTK
jgi:hypothetical protein